MRKVFLFLSIGLVVFSLAFVVAGSSAASEPTISLAQSGLVFHDQLNASQSEDQLRQSSGNWTFGGHYDSNYISYVGQNWQYSANGSNYNAGVAFSESPSGLNISVKAAGSGAYTGFYAISPPSDAELFHARITSGYNSIPGGFLQIGLYVRAASGNTNYIACASVSSTAGMHWEIIHGTGNTVEATNFDYLWIDNASVPSSADCTIVTNGDNYLAVYLDNNLVYQNSGLSLGISTPVEAYLGVESSYPQQYFAGNYGNYYSDLSNSVEALYLPSQAVNMSLVSPNGTVITSAPVQNGTGAVNVAQYSLPLTAFVKAYDSSGNEVASTAAPVQLMGGDIYSAKATIQQQVGSIVGFVSGPTFFYILIPVIVLVLAITLALSYSRRRRR